MRSLRRLSPLFLLCTVFFLGTFVGCGSDDDTGITTPPPPPEQQPSGGVIGVFTDQGGTDCNLQDPGNGVVTYYVVHMGTEGATAAEFKIEAPTTMTQVSASSPFDLSIGDPWNGMSVAYGECLGSPVVLATLRFTSTTPSPPCTEIRVVPHPATGGINVVDCEQNLLQAEGKVSYVNGDATCQCSPPVADGPTSWGKIRNILN